MSAAPILTWDEDTGSWDTDPQTWNETGQFFAPQVVVAIPGLLQLRVVDAAVPPTLQAYIQRDDMTFGEPERVKYVRRIHVRRGDMPAPLVVRVGSRMSLGDAFTWTPAVTLPARASFINTRASGRFISVRIASADASPWTVSGFDVEYEMRGYH